jgi:hypothetical protein
MNRRAGRHHVGTPGGIISECPGDFVGIRTLDTRTQAAGRRSGGREPRRELQQTSGDRAGQGRCLRLRPVEASKFGFEALRFSGAFVLAWRDVVQKSATNRSHEALRPRA